MKVKKNKVNQTNMVYPKYKQMIPLMMCMYMIGSLLVKGMDNKGTLLAVACIGMVIWFVGERIFPENIYKEIKGIIGKYIYISFGIFMLAVVLSEIFSKDYSYSNLVGESESIINVLCYVVLFYMAYRYGGEEKNQKIFKWAIIVLCVLTVVMSFIEFFDIPLANLWINEGEYLADKNRVVLSFGNSNYYGAFCTMLIPFAISLWLDCKDNIRKIVFVVLNISLICCVFMSKSTMAILLMVAVLVGTFLYCFKMVLKQWQFVIVFVLICIVEMLVINVCSGGKMLQLMNIGISNGDAFVEEIGDRYIIDDIKLSDNRLVIKGEESALIMEYNDGLIFYDEEDSILDIESKDGAISFTEEPYNEIEVMLSYNKTVSMLLVEVDAGYKDTVDFYIVNGEFKGVGADGKAVDDISGKYTKHKLNNLFTGRGYIWVNTVSMLDKVIFIGNGFGNYVNVFKQYDYVGLLKSQGTTNVIIDRPHNIFLQYCVDIGVIGTVSLAGIVIYILICWIKQCRKGVTDKEYLAYSTFAGVVAFLGFSLLNDSLVGLSPFMWIFLGINMAMQSKVQSNC